MILGRLCFQIGGSQSQRLKEISLSTPRLRETSVPSTESPQDRSVWTLMSV